MPSLFDPKDPLMGDAFSAVGDKASEALSALEGKPVAVFLVAIDMETGGFNATTNLDEQAANELICALHAAHHSESYTVVEHDHTGQTKQ